MLVYIRGAGDLASGIAVRLHRAGLSIVMSELPVPSSVRRSVCFSEAIRLGEARVEGILAERAETKEAALAILAAGSIAVLPDPEGSICRSLQPAAEVDAILAKRNIGTKMTDAPVVIGVGPGFTAGTDCHAVIETKRGHTLGRVLYTGSAIPNTGIPGNIGGFTTERVLRAPQEGIFHPERTFGDLVKKGERVANVDGMPVYAEIDGMIRGMLQDGILVSKGMKSGDIDPRGRAADYTTVSDKALAVGGGVLEAILGLSGVLRQ